MEQKNCDPRPFLSIVVLCYRVEKYLPQCLDSIRAQTFRDFEVIMVDDGSPDRCGEICDSYASADPRFRVIHQQNGGIIAARQAALRAARGLWCGSVDGDDWIEPDMYEKMCGAVTGCGVDFVQCCETLNYVDGEEPDKEIAPLTLYRGETYYGGIREQSRHFHPFLEVSLCRVILRTDALREIIGKLDPRSGLCEDAVCVYLYASRSGSMCQLGDRLYHYRRRLGSCTSEAENRRVDGLYRLFDHAKKELCGCAMEAELRKRLAAYFIRHATVTFRKNAQKLGQSEQHSYLNAAIDDPHFQSLLSEIKLQEYHLLFSKSMVELILTRELPGKLQENENVPGRLEKFK